VLTGPDGLWFFSFGCSLLPEHFLYWTAKGTARSIRFAEHKGNSWTNPSQRAASNASEDEIVGGAGIWYVLGARVRLLFAPPGI